MPEVIKSCLNCKHLKTWDYPATREDPGDSGFECTQELEDLDLCDESTQSDEECAQVYAKDCPGYEFFSWEQHYKDQCEAEAEMHNKMEEKAFELYSWAYDQFLS